MLSRTRITSAALALAVGAATAPVPAPAAIHTRVTVGGPLLPIGQTITPTAAPGSTFQPLPTGLRPDHTADANGAITTALSPDGKTLLILTTGYNANFSTTSGQPIQIPFLDPTTGLPSTTLTNTFQWVFVYDVRSGTPHQTHHIAIPSASYGLTWSPDGTRFYVSGGQDDRIYVYKKMPSPTGWAPDAPFIVLNHNSNDTAPKPTYDGGIFKGTPIGQALGGVPGLLPGAQTAGLTMSADGSTLFAANFFDDSVSLVNPVSRTVTSEVKLFTAGSNVAQGEYPLWVTPHAPRGGATDKFYVTSMRDGEVISIATTGRQKIITVGGEPGKMVLSADGSALYVANADNDEIDVIATASDTLVNRISVARPGYRYRGSNPNSVALSPDGTTLYATLGGENAVAVISVANGTVLGRIPTGWYPTAVSVSADGSRLFVVNTKANTGPNPTNGLPDPTFKNGYVLALEKAGLLTIPVPDSATLASLSATVDSNNAFNTSPGISPMMAFLRTKIKHVIFIQRENRTYDQILGDLPEGNGDPSLAMFNGPITPNAHALAQQFDDFDNFYTSGDVSDDGWKWNYQGHINDIAHQMVPVNYAGDGFNGASPYDRLQNLAVPEFGNPPNPGTTRFTSLLDPSGRSNVEPGPKALTETVGTSDESPSQTGGNLWDTMIRAGLSVRHYGQMDDETEYFAGLPIYLPIVRNAQKTRTVQGYPRYAPLFNRTDPYFRGWDLNVPDEYRFEEWQAEFNGYVHGGNLPSFEFMCIMMDHTGDFSTNVGGLQTPELDVSSNDHAIGEIVDAVSHSPYWSSTAIFVEEDDSQAGPDHVDSHRSPVLVISPWVAHGAVDSTFYNSDNVLRTMEDILGADHLGLNDANSSSMDDAFTTTPNLQPYSVIVPGDLCAPPVNPNLVPDCSNARVKKSRYVAPRHTGAWWKAHTRNFSFTGPDQNDAIAYDKVLWRGVMGDDRPYPESRSGRDLSDDRSVLIGASIDR